MGDLFLKQNKFTLYNYDEELNFFNNNFNSSYKEIVDYENFYFENRWRLQGIQTNFSYKFDRFIRTLEFDLFTSRPRGSSQISSGSNTFISDMLISGGSMVSKLNKYFSAELNYVLLKELPATGTVERAIRNFCLQFAQTSLCCHVCCDLPAPQFFFQNEGKLSLLSAERNKGLVSRKSHDRYFAV